MLRLLYGTEFVRGVRVYWVPWVVIPDGVRLPLAARKRSRLFLRSCLCKKFHHGVAYDLHLVLVPLD